MAQMPTQKYDDAVLLSDIPLATRYRTAVAANDPPILTVGDLRRLENDPLIHLLGFEHHPDLLAIREIVPYEPDPAEAPLFRGAAKEDPPEDEGYNKPRRR